MSKAFTRESDDDSADQYPAVRRLPSVLPPGTKNYVTPAGARRLRDELQALVEQRRTVPEAGATAGSHEFTDQRIDYLQRSLETAVIVEPPPPPWSLVRFGATVTVLDQDGAESRYRLVGVDEADFDRGLISWLSPLARALMNAQVGQQVRFKVPSGERELLVRDVRYE